MRNNLGIFHVDNDSIITIDEFNSSISDVGNSLEFEMENDGYLSDEELGVSGFDGGLYDEWETNNDNLLADNKLYSGAFFSYDENKDGF